MTRDALVEAVARAICAQSTNAMVSAEDMPEYVNECWDAWTVEAEELLAAIEAAGFVVVPREPTRAMLDAASSDLARTGVCGIGQWNAMLAARSGAGGKKEGEG